MGIEVEGEAPIRFPIPLTSSVSEGPKGEDMDRRGLPNNVFGVWGKGDPPAVGLDDRGHRGLLGGHTTLDALVIFQDAVEMGEGDRSLGMVGLCECGGGASCQGPTAGDLFTSWGFLKPWLCLSGP